MPARRKVTNEQLAEAYAELGSVWKVAEKVGMCGQSVHERLAKIGVLEEMNTFTDEEYERLKNDYAIYREHGRVAELAEEMGRTVQFLSRKARDLGLTSYTYNKAWKGHWKYLSDDSARMLFDDFKQSRLQAGAWCKKHGYTLEGFSKAVRQRWTDEWDAVIESKYPVQSKYRTGRAVEYRVRDQLRGHGYFVLRSPASKSPIDLVAIRPKLVLMIQCKRGGSLPPKEWNSLYDLAIGTGALPIMAEYPYPRCTKYWLLTDLKDGSKRRQPMVPFFPGDFETNGEIFA